MAPSGRHVSFPLFAIFLFVHNGAETRNQPKPVCYWYSKDADVYKKIYVSVFVFFIDGSNISRKRRLTISEVLKVFNQLHDSDLSSYEDECDKEIDIVIITLKVDVLTDDESVNEDDLFHDPGIPKKGISNSA